LPYEKPEETNPAEKLPSGKYSTQQSENGITIHITYMPLRSIFQTGNPGTGI